MELKISSEIDFFQDLGPQPDGLRDPSAPNRILQITAFQSDSDSVRKISCNSTVRSSQFQFARGFALSALPVGFSVRNRFRCELRLQRI